MEGEAFSKHVIHINSSEDVDTEGPTLVFETPPEDSSITTIVRKTRALSRVLFQLLYLEIDFEEMRQKYEYSQDILYRIGIILENSTSQRIVEEYAYHKRRVDKAEIALKKIEKDMLKASPLLGVIHDNNLPVPSLMARYYSLFSRVREELLRVDLIRATHQVAQQDINGVLAQELVVMRDTPRA